ncbi:DUF1679 domain-containing protein [Candidatus Venteria ishoeyi]|uniref:oxidoreductase family protein n=1 Tax=Candidatus Venteria ishoeyi TaxID=1899563 RepID=UPI0025A504C8|nr:oxidoreductase family protein [Candidatus Venteria ishoeyi]MDM8546853.1 DUF1679 domain-containing protein [Candidatus Venteria ishoeyi]
MSNPIEKLIQQSTRAKDVEFDYALQSLWSGYGSIDRYQLTGSQYPSVIVKHVRLPDKKNHPRGWNTDLSHQRKLKSYQVETHWYEHYARHCDNNCRIPQVLNIKHHGNEIVMIMEDLDASGFPLRKQSIGLAEMKLCLRWLAFFHARFMQQKPKGLWSIGTYWHLDTRPDELKAMPDNDLKRHAAKIDQLLNATPYKTLVHGDAKLANFCFSSSGEAVAAVDFQYVGGGNGMKDVAYFISSCLDENECEAYEASLLDIYFDFLKQALQQYQPAIDTAQVEESWRAAYPLAWTDFFRFLQGWSPGHWKIHRYSSQIAKQVIQSLC